MKMKVATTLFNFAFSFLYQLVDKALLLFDRDSAELAQFGIDAAFKTDLETKNTALKNAPDDIALRADVSIATDERDAWAEQVKAAIRPILARAIVVFGEGSPKHKKFGATGMNDMNPDQLYKCALDVLDAGTLYLTELSGAGLTQAMLDNLETLSEKIDNGIDTKTDKVMDRDVATEQRIIDANEVYLKVVSMFRFGKVYWVDKSEAKYNDYVIYNTSDGQPPADGQFGMAHGTVTNTLNGNFIAGAQIVLEGVAAPIITDANGNWSANQIPMSTLTISATALGYDEFDGPITLHVGQDVVINIAMTPTP